MKEHDRRFLWAHGNVAVQCHTGALRCHYSFCCLITKGTVVLHILCNVESLSVTYHLNPTPQLFLFHQTSLIASTSLALSCLDFWAPITYSHPPPSNQRQKSTKYREEDVGRGFDQRVACNGGGDVMKGDGFDPNDISFVWALVP